MTVGRDYPPSLLPSCPLSPPCLPSLPSRPICPSLVTSSSPSSLHLSIGVSSVNFRGNLGQDIFARKNMYEKLTKCSNFTWFLREKLAKYPTFYDICRKVNKIPEFYMLFARKNGKILHNNCPKNIFPDFFRGGGRKNSKISDCLWYLPEKLTKFLSFTWFLPEKCQNFT